MPFWHCPWLHGDWDEDNGFLRDIVQCHGDRHSHAQCYIAGNSAVKTARPCGEVVNSNVQSAVRSAVCSIRDRSVLLALLKSSLEAGV